MYMSNIFLKDNSVDKVVLLRLKSLSVHRLPTFRGPGRLKTQPHFLLVIFYSSSHTNIQGPLSPPPPPPHYGDHQGILFFFLAVIFSLFFSRKLPVNDFYTSV